MQIMLVGFKSYMGWLLAAMTVKVPKHIISKQPVIN